MSNPLRRPALRYHGGKWLLAPWIIGHFPEHKIYVEPFGGAGSVLLRKPRSPAEVYNDLWSEVVNVFSVLRNPAMAAELERVVRLTPFAREEFEVSGSNTRSTDPIERARLTLVRSFMGMGSAATNAGEATGFRANQSNRNTVGDWVNYPDHIEALTERLTGVIIENRPAVDVMRQHDSPETLHYVDPPYPLSTRNIKRGNAYYAHELTDDDHRELSEALKQLAGMVIVSGYPCDLYDKDLFKDWHRITKAAMADGAKSRTEVLWLNQAAAEAQTQHDLISEAP